MSRRWFERFSRDEGQTAVVVALVMSALLLSVGLAIDSGKLYSARRSSQVAADVAAWAGAVELFEGGTAVEAIAAAEGDAGRNGYADGGLITVSVESPPLSGPFAGQPSYVRVIITEQVATTFLPGSVNGRTHVQTVAVAGSIPLGAGNAIHTLSEDDSQSFVVGGNGSISVTGGNVLVNSSHPTAAARLTGNGDVNVTSPHQILVAGGYQDSGNGEFNPEPTTGASQQSDPLTWLAEPDMTGLPVTDNFQHSANGDITIQPGVYNNGIQLSGNGSLIMEPGLYILRDGGFSVSGNGSISGVGVTIFNTLAGYPSIVGDCDRIQFTGNGELTLSAPTSGTYQGLLIWQDRNCEEQMQMAGNGSLSAASGTIYLPQADLQISGNGSLDVGFNTQLVVQNLALNGNADIVITYDEALTVPMRAPALVE